MKKIIQTLFAIVFSIQVNAQSISGVSGLINIPSGYLNNDGSFFVGYSSIPPGVFQPFWGGDNPRGNGGYNLYANIVFLPRVELSFRYSFESNIKPNKYSNYFPDRSSAIRFLLKRESPSVPSLVLGLHDVSRIFDNSEREMFSNIYIASSKEINFITNSKVTIGYGFDTKQFKSRQYKGLFGGIEFGLNNLVNFDIISQPRFKLEYDSQFLNTGVEFLILDYVFIQGNIQDLLNNIRRGTGITIAYKKNLK